MLTPSSDVDEVKRRLQATDEAYRIDRLKGNAPFGGITDIRSGLHRARIGGMLNPAELIAIASSIFGGRRLKRFVESVHEEEPVQLIYGICGLLSENKPLEDEIKSCIDEQGEVLDSASPALMTIRKELRNGESRIREKLEQMLRTSSVQFPDI